MSLTEYFNETTRESFCASCNRYLDIFTRIETAVASNHVRCLERFFEEIESSIMVRGFITHAAEHGSLECLEMLIKKYPEHLMKRDSIALKMALHHSHIDCAKYLIEKGCTPSTATIARMKGLDLNDLFWRNFLFFMLQHNALNENQEVKNRVQHKFLEIQYTKDTLAELYRQNKLSKDIMIYKIHPLL